MFDSIISIQLMMECLDLPFELVFMVFGWDPLIWKINGLIVDDLMKIEVFLCFMYVSMMDGRDWM